MLIVFEGLDAAGKSTLIANVADFLRDRSCPVHVLHFPRPSIAPLITKVVEDSGKESNPFAASLPFALDRWLSRHDWLPFHRRGDFVLLDRYVLSNLAYQGANLSGSAQLDFFRWLDDLEFNKLQLPRPDLTVLVEVVESLRQERLLQRAALDSFERDLDFARRVRLTYDALPYPLLRLNPDDPSPLFRALQRHDSGSKYH